MRRLFENTETIHTQYDYELLNAYIDYLIKEATDLGYLADPQADNEYVRELGRLARLNSNYENQYVSFNFEREITVEQMECV
jgi:hypothetical protein